MIEKRFNIVDLLETMAISDNDECKYYQNSNDDFKKLCDLLNEYEDKYAKSLWDYNGLGCEYEGLKQENEQLKDDVYDEMDDALEVLVELYEYVPFDSRKKMNKLYNRLKSLRDDMND